MRNLKLAALLSGVFAAPHCLAQGVSAVKPVQGYSCMRLNVPREQIIGHDLNVPVFSTPSASGEKVGRAIAVLIVKSPVHIENGFAEILTLNGRRAWIQRGLLSPYATAEQPNLHCTPSIMSDGGLGFGS